MLATKNFTHINTGFSCVFCGLKVQPLARGCRNHCPRCLTSMHVDVQPGDRAAHCGGAMRAVGYSVHSKKGIMITFRCQRCGQSHRNKAALNDPKQPDHYDQILALQ